MRDIIGNLPQAFIELFNAITVPISKIKSVPEVVQDPLVKDKLLHAVDPNTGTRITLAPPPNMTEFLNTSDNELSFPPRFGEHNEEIYGDRLGLSAEQLDSMKKKGVI